jgi:hypothetical protein
VLLTTSGHPLRPTGEATRLLGWGDDDGNAIIVSEGDGAPEIVVPSAAITSR